MSFFEDASLALIPSAQKTSKVYSVKPTDGTGDLTFTRSNDTATRVGPDGLIEKVRTNLILQSQALNTAAWNLVTSGTGITPVVTANNATAPDGTMTADTIVFNAGAGTTASDISTINQSATIGSQTYSGSFYARVASGTGQLVFRHAAGGTYTTANLTTTWQRFSSTETGSSTFEIGIRRGLANEPINASVTVEIWGVQLETGDIATDYIATTTAAVSVGPVANVPRLDYLNSSCPRLLLEPQRTNLLTNSENGTGTNWGNPYQVSVTANQTTSPDGYVNADSVADTASNTPHRFEPSFNATNGTAYTFSYFAKANTLTQCHIYGFTDNLVFSGQEAIFNLSNDTVVSNTGGGTASITSYGNGWYRVSLTLTAGATSLGYWGFGPAKNGAVGYLGNGSSLYMWGIQLEVGAYATSYIPTLGAAVTRGADACSKTGISSLIGQTEGTVFAEFANPAKAANGRYFSISDGDVGNRIDVYAPSPTQIGIYAAKDYVEIINVQFTVPANAPLKYAIAYKAGSWAWYLNGVQIGTSANTNVPIMNMAQLGTAANGGASAEGNSAIQALLFKTRLTNAQLAELTTI